MVVYLGSLSESVADRIEEDGGVDWSTSRSRNSVAPAMESERVPRQVWVAFEEYLRSLERSLNGTFGWMA
jgi:hypothetical protein